MKSSLAPFSGQCSVNYLLEMIFLPFDTLAMPVSVKWVTEILLLYTISLFMKVNIHKCFIGLGNTCRVCAGNL